MAGKQLFLDTLRAWTVPRTPWLPYVGAHGRFLLDVSVRDCLRLADLIARGQSESAALCQADGIPVVFDPRLEAEVLGCCLSVKNVPALCVDGNAPCASLTPRHQRTDPIYFETLPRKTRRMSPNQGAAHP